MGQISQLGQAFVVRESVEKKVSFLCLVAFGAESVRSTDDQWSLAFLPCVLLANDCESLSSTPVASCCFNLSCCGALEH